MYDRRLDAILAAAELGSFTQAAERLHISTTALVKQVNTFEAEYRLVLFERTRRGVALTPTGRVFIDDARGFVRQAHDVLRHARRAEEGASVRLGVSTLSPGQKVLDDWPRIHELDPSLRLELVPCCSIYDAQQNLVAHLGDDVDVALASWSPDRWEGTCRALLMESLPLRIDVVRTSPLAARDAIEVSDLAGMRVYTLRHVNPASDALALELDAICDVIRVEDYTLDVFNECAHLGGALVTSGAWSGLHPMMVGVPLVPERLAQCALLHALDPSPEVARFIDTYRLVLAERDDDNQGEDEAERQ